MSAGTEDALALAPPRWRAAAGRALLGLPAPLREAAWRTWRRLDRMRRRRLEARGDYSRSSPALYDMDRRLAAHIDLAPGFFVEAGANDGYHQSNTYRLERVHGWRGVLVEPVPSLYRAARRERPAAQVFNCALVAPADPRAPETVVIIPA